MKQLWTIIPFALLLLLSACDPDGDGNVVRCEDLQDEQELSFGMAYCQGDFCRTYEDQDGNQRSVTSMEECEVIDVVIRGSIEEWGQDGEGDCKWVEDTQPYCAPSR